MLLKEIKVTGVNPAVTWLDKKLQKLGYETRISLRGSVYKQYIHLISGVNSVTIRVIDPTLPIEKQASFDYDYTLYVGVDNLSKKQKHILTKPNTTSNPENVIEFIKNKT